MPSSSFLFSHHSIYTLFIDQQSIYYPLINNPILIYMQSIQYDSYHGWLRPYNIHQWSRLRSSKRRTQMPNPLFDWWDTNNTITTRKAQEMSQMATEFIKYGFKGCRETDPQIFSLTNISQETTIPHVFNFTIFLSRKGDGTQNVILEATQVSARCWAVDVTVAVPTVGKCPGWFNLMSGGTEIAGSMIRTWNLDLGYMVPQTGMDWNLPASLDDTSTDSNIDL